MFGFMFRKQKAVEELLAEYLHSVEIAQQDFADAMKTYLEAGGCCPDFEFLTAETHKAESRSDDIQEKMIRFLFEKALIPELRGDILILMEAVDEVPDQFDRVLYGILTQKIVLQDTVKPDLKELVAVSMETCSFMLEDLRALFERSEQAGRILTRVDQLESHGDHIERRLITRIFESDWDPLQKILLRDLTLALGDIADLALSVCRQVNLITVKRRV